MKRRSFIGALIGGALCRSVFQKRSAALKPLSIIDADGVNCRFRLAPFGPDRPDRIEMNGELLRVGRDYTFSNGEVTFFTPPHPGPVALEYVMNPMILI